MFTCDDDGVTLVLMLLTSLTCSAHTGRHTTSTVVFFAQLLIPFIFYLNLQQFVDNKPYSLYISECMSQRYKLAHDIIKHLSIVTIIVNKTITGAAYASCSEKGTSICVLIF